MAALNFLPDEILLAIMKQAVPEGIEALSLCCKHFHGVAEEILEQYMIDKKKYTTVSLQELDDQQLPNSFHPLKLLRDVLQDRRLILYPETVNVDIVIPNPADPLDNRTELVEEMKDEIRDVVATCPYIDSLDRPEWGRRTDHWERKIKSNNLEAACILLLTLFPRIKKIFIKGDFTWEEGYFNEMIAGIVEKRSESRAGAQQSGALSQLAEIHTAQYWIDSGDGDNSLMFVFSQLPSIRILRGCHMQLLNTTFCHGDLIGLYPEVTEIEIRKSIIAPASINSFLSELNVLTKFKYQLRSAWDMANPLPKFSPAAFLDILSRYASQTLEELELTWDAVQNLPMSSNDVGHLHKFATLKKIRTNLELYTACYEHLGDIISSCLLDKLPVSAEVVEVIGASLGSPARNESTGLLRGIQGFQGHLPNLRRITFEDTVPSSEVTQKDMIGDIPRKSTFVGRLGERGQG